MREFLRGWLSFCARDGAEGPTRFDAVLVVALLLAGAVELLTTSPALATWIVSPLLILPLYVHRRYGVIAFIGTVGMFAPVFGFQLTFTAVFALLFAVWSAAAFGTRQEAIATGIGTAVAVSVVATALLLRGAGFTDALANLTLFATAWVVGDNVRQRRERLAALEARAEALERGHARDVAAAAVGERARIARELHDVVAHTVSVMVVQAGAARHVVGRDPAKAEQAIAEIERTGRDALTELRRLLGVLRAEDDAAGQLAPQPGLASLHELVAQLDAAGLPVDLEVHGTTAEVGPAVELTVFRVVQEALTNTVKHAGPARATVVVTHTQDAIEIDIEDDGRGAAGALSATGGGLGLDGMRERVALFGGRLEAGPRAGGGYRVHATVPTVDAAPAPAASVVSSHP